MLKEEYAELSEITVKSQEELDEIPLDFKGRIYIEFGTWDNKAIIKNNYYLCVVAWGNSSVEAWGNSSVEAWENSSVVARGNSSVGAWENSSVVGNGNSQIVNCLSGTNAKIKISGNSRIVFNPNTIMEYLDFYGLKHDKKKCKLFKAVRKLNGKFISDRYSSFEYKIGEIIKADGLNTDVNEDCGNGIHLAHLDWCLKYGNNWENLSILECEADIDDIIVPLSGVGKVRVDKVSVLREIPLEECGVYGKILAKKIKKEIK